MKGFGLERALDTLVPPEDFVEYHAPLPTISEAEVRQRVLTLFTRSIGAS